MYQNRAAALERLERYEEALKDCGESIRLNNRYGKSYDRRCKILKKIVENMKRLSRIVESPLDSITDTASP